MEKSFLEQFVENLAELFGDKCEIVIHDFSNGFDRTVVKIINGHVSGRSVGDSATTRLFDSFKSLDDYEQKGSSVYYTRTPDGKTLKSCSTLIRDPFGKATGAICVNYDISEFIEMQKKIGTFIGDAAGEGIPEAMRFQDVNDLLNHYLGLTEQTAGKRATDMNKKERMEALKFLDDRGILQISKAHIRLCEFFGISKYTLYTDLDEIRKKSAESE